MEGRIVNSIAANDRVDDKTLQLRVARSCGLAIPSTVILNNYNEIYTFVAKRKKLVLKPLTMTWGCFGEA